ncbi:MAG: class I SAM-dependent methyltransferase [Defluviitaleaceae bacterium]|nr:class I SAM-dependent methyltransferase [Defluviitaleaceae bacterium]
MEISERLSAIAGTVRYGTMVDIGTDHAYLPIALCKMHKINSALATDINKSPILRAKANIEKNGLSEQIKTQLCAGLEGVTPAEYESCVIAGMGGMEIIKILRNSLDVAYGFRQLVFSPQRDIRALRIFLYENDFYISNEIMLKDSGKFYNILDCGIGRECAKYTEEEYIFGRYLIENHCKVLAEYIEIEIMKTQHNMEFLNTKHSRYKELNQYLYVCKNILEKL